MKQQPRFLSSFLALMLYLGVSVGLYAAPTEQSRVVRVGWFESIYNLTDELGQRYGYGYEYQQNIAAAEGWTYEYVKGTWPELLAQLERGEIDLMSGVVPTPELQKKLLFSTSQMGEEGCYVVFPSQSGKILRADLESLRGLRIGVVRNSNQERMLRTWLGSANIEMEVIPCNLSEEECLERMKVGEFDAVACASIFYDALDDWCEPFAHFGTTSVYFAVSPKRPDIQYQIDLIMDKMKFFSPNYQRDLCNKYLWDLSTILRLSYEEKEWLKSHDTIRIGYRIDYLPFCSIDPETGQVMGLLHDFIEQINDKMGSYGICLEAVAYPDLTEALEAVKRGEVDAAFPSSISISHAEDDSMVVTDPLVRTIQLAVVREDFDGSLDDHLRVAVNQANAKRLSIIQEQYPNWEIVLFPTFEDCLEGISKRKADVIITSDFRISPLIKEMSRWGLKSIPTGSTFLYSFIFNQGDPQLFTLFCRMVNVLSDDELNSSLVRNAAAMGDTSIEDFMRAHITLMLCGFLFVIVGFSVLLLLSYRANRRAKSASESKSRFLFSMSHDIRTPMNAILGYTELLEHELKNPVKSQDYLEKIHTSGRFLLDLINNVLEMSRIESGKMELNEQPHLISDVLHDAVAVYSDLMREKGIDLSYSLNTRVQAIYCDRMKINQIMLNLLSNACKYTPKGGRVTITLEQKVNPRRGYVSLLFKISDTGVGMSKEYLPHVFEDFTRERSYTDNKIYGTGLGMSIVKNLVELMHGKVSVESELGKGTTFTILAEHRVADASLLVSDKTAETELPSFEGRKILLVEDNDLNAEIAMEILSSKGFVINWVKDGQQCVDMIEQSDAQAFDIVLMDIQMPVMNGYEATKAIRQMSDHAKASIPIVAMTANAFDEDRRNAALAGMNGHVAKPINVSVLLQTIARLLPA